MKLGTFPSSKDELSKLEQSKPAPAGQTSLAQLGLTLTPARQGTGKEGGVVIAEVEPGSDAAQKGLKSGDVILEVQGQPVTTADEVLAGVKKAAELGRKAVLLHVKSADKSASWRSSSRRAKTIPMRDGVAARSLWSGPPRRIRRRT